MHRQMLSKKSTIYLKEIQLKGGMLRYLFRATGQVKDAFLNYEFEIKYDESIESVPVSVAAIPFVANMLPVAWVYDAELVVDELDVDFYDHLEDIRRGYAAMYPRIEFGGAVVTQKAVKNRVQLGGDPALLFSGGVDAMSSLISVLSKKEHPRLVTLWGADVSLRDIEGWEEKSGHTKGIAEEFSLSMSLVKTGFRGFLDESALGGRVSKGTDDGWWHGFQHGIGIIGHIAPLVHLYGIPTTYIAASFTRGDHVSCASDPTIDENVHIAGSTVIHDGYDFNRQDKIRQIHQFVKDRSIKSLPIKVCWKSEGAKNCGRCEKCIRSACGFLVEGADLSVYDMGTFDMEYARNYITKKHYFRHTIQWREIQARLKVTSDILSDDRRKELQWLLEFDLDNANKGLGKRVRRSVVIVKSKVAQRMPKNMRRHLKRIMGRR